MYETGHQMKIGYARTSTVKQNGGLLAQIALLEQQGCSRDDIFSEQVSSVEPRAQLEAAIRSLQRGDVLVVTKLDRLARSLEHAIGLERRIADKGASLQVLDPAMDTASPIGRLLFSMLGAVAQFEREIMLERQREGIAKAKADGKYKGRQPTARRRSAEVVELREQGVGPSAIAQRLGIGRASVYRILGDRASSGQ
jgi:DNA invertase Pin-like site-specific DNA recombinase